MRVIVLTGRGKAFCAGAQLGAMGSVTQSIQKTDQDKLTSLVGDRQPYHLTTLCKPVIAAINGSCVGIGLTQALSATCGSPLPEPSSRRHSRVVA